MKRILYIVTLFLTLSFHSQLAATSVPSKFITMNLPEAVLADTLTKVLPLELDTSSNTLQGTITIIDIDELDLEDKKLSCRLKLRGDNLHLVTEISGHEIRLKVGNIELNFKCDASIRFDPKKQVLYVRPVIKDAKSSNGSGTDDIGLTLLSLLNEREFPIALQDLKPLIAEASNKTITIKMQIADIRAVKNGLKMSLEPSITTNTTKQKAKTQ